MKTAAFSIVSPNYRHYARVLMASVAEQHPEWDRFVLLVGGNVTADDAREPFTIVPLDVLPLPRRREFCFRYTILELNTAVKPWMFAELFARGYERVIYFDPDVRLFSRLDELDRTDDEAFLTLTPHLTGSIGTDDEHPSERTILQAGAYNLGFLAARQRPQLSPFLAWWQEKLEYQCVVDVARGLFVDQKWIDLVPGLFPGVAVLRHDGYNVAYWNLAQRTIERHGDDITVNGAPLRFFHFSGYDPARPENVSKNDPRQLLAHAGDAAPLIDDYGDALRAAGAQTFRDAPYRYAHFVDGTRIPDRARIAYRHSPELQAAAGDDPFAHPELFAEHRDARRNAVAARAALYSYRALSSVRPLVTLLPRSLRKSAREFLLGRKEGAPLATHAKTSLATGLNIAGDAPESRLVARACDEGGLAHQLIDGDAEPRYRATLVYVNGDRMPAVREQRPRVFRSGAYTIGGWHWELPELPDTWIASAEALDEIWAPSAFVQSAIGRKVAIPVVHMPPGVAVTDVEPCTPQDLGVPPRRFTFLCTFDFDDVVERVNPFAAIEAFRRAFPQDDSVALLVKTTNTDLTEAVRGIANVYRVDRELPRAQMHGLLSSCDAVVSLHRAESFGLTLAEAMDLGKPVIATAWSGNMDFMHAGNSCPVAYELVTLDRAHGPYAAGQRWAEPDVDHAAHCMRRLVDDAEFRARIGARARETIRAEFSPRAAGLRIRQRLALLDLL
ncbi:MAG: glycosyltransferase family 4 protein [Acidobacteria bacterium]|nr:glycosyltransferase family 4 protein [Acidobacteriota bacterium]MBV9478112.1 glycosyltransferase family 4 protein [Acidobacteriota bacterium]